MKMTSFWFCAVFLLSSALTCLVVDAREIDKDEYLARALRDYVEKRSGPFQCNARGEKCRGIIPCCGSLQCYWPDGYSMTTPGHCVECISQGQYCQRDNQCCSPLVCQKGGTYHVDGRCDAARAKGADCHDHDQCASKSCNINYWQKVTGQEGKCN